MIRLLFSHLLLRVGLWSCKVLKGVETTRAGLDSNILRIFIASRNSTLDPVSTYIVIRDCLREGNVSHDARESEISVSSLTFFFLSLKQTIQGM